MPRRQSSLEILRTVRSLIRRRLREKKLSYGDLARRIGVSEGTFKRWMTSQEIRLSDLLRIGRELDFTIQLPVDLDALEQPLEEKYSVQQEAYLVRHPVAALLFIKLLVGHSLEEAMKECRISMATALKYLREMESNGF